MLKQRKIIYLYARKEPPVKKFFMVTPQQPQGKLHAQRYVSTDNPLLTYDGATHFPVIPLINGYAEKDENIEVITITYGEPSNCEQNLETLRGELAGLAAVRGLAIELVPIRVPFDDSVGALIHAYQLLIDRIEDGDTLHACITFGSKPMPIMLTMALQYGYRIKRDVSIECVVYGQMDWSSDSPTARIYDVTALTKLDEMVRVLAERQVANPESVLRMALGFGENEDA